MAPPVANRLVAQALREEASHERMLGRESVSSTFTSIHQSIANTLVAVADRLEQAGSSVTSWTPTPAPDAPPISPSAPSSHRPDKSRPETPPMVRHQVAIHATLVELKRVLGGRLHNDARAQQLLDDAIKLSS